MLNFIQIHFGSLSLLLLLFIISQKILINMMRQTEYDFSNNHMKIINIKENIEKEFNKEGSYDFDVIDKMIDDMDNLIEINQSLNNTINVLFRITTAVTIGMFLLIVTVLTSFVFNIFC